MNSISLMPVLKFPGQLLKNLDMHHVLIQFMEAITYMLMLLRRKNNQEHRTTEEQFKAENTEVEN